MFFFTVGSLTSLMIKLKSFLLSYNFVLNRLYLSIARLRSDNPPYICINIPAAPAYGVYTSIYIPAAYGVYTSINIPAAPAYGVYTSIYISAASAYRVYTSINIPAVPTYVVKLTIGN
jgi:hypothetical protein